MREEGNDAENDEIVELANKYLVEDGGVVSLRYSRTRSII